MKRIAAALLLWCGLASAEAPPVIAIRNARIVTVSGPTIAKGAVIVRNGLIDAVGENLAIPPEALVVEGEGLTVYPGLIDPLSTLGIPGAAPATPSGGRGTTGGRGAVATTVTTPQAQVTTIVTPRSNGPEDRPQTTSWLQAADEIQSSDPRIPNVRGAGVTTAITFPTRGIFAGQGAVIDLIAAEKAGQMVVESPVGQYISIGRGGFGGGMGGGYPGALMGIIAYVRQIYIDADHYRLVKEAYAKNPRGMERPQYDHALEGVLESKRVLIPANRLVEIDRIIRFVAELKQPAILYGAREAYRPEAVELLKKAGLPVLVSMKWPTPPTGPDVHLEEESMRQLETWDEAPAAPAALAKAGVKFALYSDGIDTARDFQRAVKKALDAGLTREQALRALTLTPAEMYGIADRVGSIEKGKIGNLVVARGDLFENTTKIEMVIVDGKKYTPVADTAPGGRGPTTDAPGGDR
jgi:imidazolonepropionase-like amidohydrolase